MGGRGLNQRIFLIVGCVMRWQLASSKVHCMQLRVDPTGLKLQ